MKYDKVIITCVLILMLGITRSPASSSANPLQTGRLGKVRFVNSCSPQAQAEFDSAVAMLHSFQYSLAEKAFTRVTQRDPQCAIAYWGAAMTLYHQLWEWPSPVAMKKGRQYLEKAKPLKKKTARELAYLKAAEAFYQPEKNPGWATRAQVYAKAMHDLHERYPEDDDASAFYALSLLALPFDADDRLLNQQKALAILTKLFSAQPEHPGAAHYLIHATDTAELAPLGLPAALRYAQIAPASPHALHMPSHIFARLGMWQESIASNLASLSAADEATRSRSDDGSGDALHAMMYLEYSYLQSGEQKDARQVVDRVERVPGATSHGIANNIAIFQALYAVETHNWELAAILPPQPGAFPYAQIRTFWARAIGAARIGDVAAARQNMDQLDQAVADMSANTRSTEDPMHPCHSVDSDVTAQQLEAKAWLAWADRRPAEALDKMRAAASKEKFYGVESQTVPASEMLGDLLLEMQQPESALIAYETALRRAPARFNALTGAARASRALGNSEKARFYYATLVKCCGPSVTRKEFGEAKLFLSEN